MIKYLPIIAIFAFLSIHKYSVAQQIKERHVQLIEIAEKIKEYYIYEDIAIELSTKLKTEISKNLFNDLTNEQFADSLSRFLVKNGNDKHFNVICKPRENPLENSKNQNKKEFHKEINNINRQWNYGFEKVERLDGNIGYIECTGFTPFNNQVKRVLRASMDMVSHTNALIIDLRDNFGGDGKLVSYFLSYFIEKKVKLGETYTRYSNKTSKSYSEQKVMGQKYLNKPLFILVSNNTVSAAEGFAYELQQLKRAKIIGSKTYGAANPIKTFYIDNLYQVFIPVSLVKNAVTNSNWEHIGVPIDIITEPQDALKKAHSLALQQLLDSKTKFELPNSEIIEKIKELKID